MDFTLSSEQGMIRDTAQNLFRKECTLDVVRQAWGNRACATVLWEKQLSAWLELVEGDLIDLALFMEEHGRALAPGPFYASLIARVVAQAAQIKLSAGKATVAISDQQGLWVPNNSGIKHFVPSADEAEHIVLISGSLEKPEIAILNSQQVVITEIDNMDRLRPIFKVETKHQGVAQAFDKRDFKIAQQKIMIATAAELIGVGRHALDSAVAYAKERQQFGKVIGSFQGLQWKLVNATIELERAAAAVSYAAMCVDAHDADAEKATLSAKAEAGLAARHCARTSMQVHGGIGYTWEHGLHYALRRAYAGDAFMGNHEHQFTELAKLLF